MTRPAIDLVADPARAAVLADPLRRRVLGALREGEDSAAGLAGRLGEGRQRLNYHLRELERAGFVELVAERRKGNCIERVMRPTADYLLIDPAAGGTTLAPEAVGDRFSASFLMALAARAVREVASAGEGARRTGQRLAIASLETEVHLARPDDFAAFARDLGEAVAAVVERHHRPDAPGARAFRVALGTYPRPAARPDEAAAPPAEQQRRKR